MSFEIVSPSGQVAAHLREELGMNRWKSELPGTPFLAAELNVDRKTVIAAIRELEVEGLLESQGPGRCRKIVLSKTSGSGSLNIRLIPYEDVDAQLPYVLELTHRIRQLGHVIGISSKSLTGMGMDLKRISGFVKSHPADAWILMAGSEEILQWFSAQTAPSIAIFGRRRKVNMASVGPDKLSAIRNVVTRLVELGHRRIVYLVREERRQPTPGVIERLFLNELAAHGIPSGPYNLPDWQDNPDSFHECLNRVFAHTPPSALITDEAQFFVAAHQHLTQRGIIAPQDVSLVCCDTHPLFNWCQPEISHIHWDSRHVVKQIVQWVDLLGRGRNERTAHFTPAEFVEGGTIGPARL